MLRRWIDSVSVSDVSVGFDRDGRVLLVFGSALTSDSPRDIDVAYEGEFGADEIAIVRAWASRRGLASDLPIDAKQANAYRGLRDQETARIILGTPFLDGRDRYEVLRGECIIEWAHHHALPARIRRSESVEQLLAELRGVPDHRDGRMACLEDAGCPESVRADWQAYCQGRLALRNAIAKCPFWAAAELLDSRVAFIREFAERGACESVRAEIAGAGQAGADGAGFNMVTLEGIGLSYPLPGARAWIPWAEILA